MSDDRELLELAAKAAGIIGKWYESIYESGYELPDGCNQPLWNPLTDDGDALRLAVKLSFHIEIERRFVRVWYTETECVELKCKPSDIDEATRRAIVRAAADIGKQQV